MEKGRIFHSESYYYCNKSPIFKFLSSNLFFFEMSIKSILSIAKNPRFIIESFKQELGIKKSN